jgi:hypothetical protein
VQRTTRRDRDERTRRLKESHTGTAAWKTWGPYLSERQWGTVAGLGASHQTGWTGVVAKLIQLFGLLDAKQLLETGKEAAFAPGTPTTV